MGTNKRDAMIAGFLSKVDRSAGPDGCWPYMGKRRPDGYGVLGFNGAYRAHRLALELAQGSPVTLDVLHSCDNPPCCNPAHLREGTHAENMRDMTVRGRRSNPPRHLGSAHPMAKLTEETVWLIRWCARLGDPSAVLADAFRVSISTIHLIRKERIWKEVVI